MDSKKVVPACVRKSLVGKPNKKKLTEMVKILNATFLYSSHK